MLFFLFKNTDFNLILVIKQRILAKIFTQNHNFFTQKKNFKIASKPFSDVRIVLKKVLFIKYYNNLEALIFRTALGPFRRMLILAGDNRYTK